jgi:hypothetical protein
MAFSQLSIALLKLVNDDSDMASTGRMVHYLPVCRQKAEHPLNRLVAPRADGQANCSEDQSVHTRMRRCVYLVVAQLVHEQIQHYVCNTAPIGNHPLQRLHCLPHKQA